MALQESRIRGAAQPVFRQNADHVEEREPTSSYKYFDGEFFWPGWIIRTTSEANSDSTCVEKVVGTNREALDMIYLNPTQRNVAYTYG